MLLTANVLGRLGGPPEEMAALDATFEFVEGESALVFREMACEALFRKTACKTKVGNQIRWPSWNRLSHALEFPRANTASGDDGRAAREGVGPSRRLDGRPGCQGDRRGRGAL